MYSIDGPWTREEEDELLRLYHVKPIPGLEDGYRFEGRSGAGVYSRREALEKIKQIRRITYGRGEDHAH